MSAAFVWRMEDVLDLYAQPPDAARPVLMADGTAVVQSATQDLGTGTYTVMPQVAADALGLPMERVRFALGDTNFPPATTSGRSITAAVVSSAVALAAANLRRDLVRMVSGDARSPLQGATEGDITVEDGRVFLTRDRSRGETYTEILTRRAMPMLEAMGNWNPPMMNERFSTHSFGAQFAEVAVDPDLGTVRVRRMVGVFGAGRVLNEKTARSQMIGGMVWSLGQALLERTEIDPTFARYTNDNLAEYLVPVHADIPAIVGSVEEGSPALVVTPSPPPHHPPPLLRYNRLLAARVAKESPPCAPPPSFRTSPVCASTA